ncbi:phosphodiester glycosidase family protein [Actinomycetaceae bacterium MB13-C1-2]|nr:phosphodiester glycosidase family protein [Actinomycetaceae bacterium MB13-C1-2]
MDSPSPLVAVGISAWALDRFVIDHVEISDVAAYEAAQSPTAVSERPEAEQGQSETPDSPAEQIPATVTDSTYEGSNASISITQQQTGSGEDTVTYYVATVNLSDATALRSAFANNQFGQSIIDKTSSIAEQNGAIFAINGDYYGFRDTGIVIRNGVLFRDAGAREGLAFYQDGTVQLYDETATSADQLVTNGVWNTLSFGPALVADGTVIAGIDQIEIDTNFGNHSIQGQQPRTLVGVRSDGTLVLVVIDGRETGYSRGMTMSEAAELMVSLDCQTAYNLDGGGSSTMYFNGAVINEPSNGGERGTSDILYIEDLS